MTGELTGARRRQVLDSTRSGEIELTPADRLNLIESNRRREISEFLTMMLSFQHTKTFRTPEGNLFTYTFPRGVFPDRSKEPNDMQVYPTEGRMVHITEYPSDPDHDPKEYDMSLKPWLAERGKLHTDYSHEGTELLFSEDELDLMADFIDHHESWIEGQNSG